MSNQLLQADLPRRNTRSRSRQGGSTMKELEASPSTESLAISASQISISSTAGASQLDHLPISVLPHSSKLTTKFTGLPKRDISLLQQKQRKLSTTNPLIDDHGKPAAPHEVQALAATLVFAQKEAGTAVCISPTGLLLTCSHCISEEPDELEDNRIKWLLFSSGRVVKTTCIAYDAVKDLALLQVDAADPPSNTLSSSSSSLIPPTLGKASTDWTSFPYLEIPPAPPTTGMKLICIGHPGDEDLEVDEAGVKTGYDVLHVSHGRFRGLAEGHDILDNSEIGALMHDCWTYWGHSGAPLVGAGARKAVGKGNRASGLADSVVGRLLGMHSSWDDQTGMRRGIAWEAIVEFLKAAGNPQLAWQN